MSFLQYVGVGGVTIDDGKENRADGDGVGERVSEGDDNESEKEDEEIEIEAP